ncbi:MAG: methyltransferase domain-containing protein [Betaproteobacteria bacterium]|nr:MAG: methyltransferase domain-containing protein [Betaproteobacteria bacterium]
MRMTAYLGAAAITLALLALQPRPAHAQERFSLFVGSDPTTVERMVQLAGLRDGETVIDLGSGDGRVVFAAAQANPSVRGIGVDIDAKLVKQANARAEELGLSDRVRFEHRNAFDADLSEVDVIFMWFFPELMRLIRVKILDQARAGTRVVAPLWGFGSWPPDATDKGSTDVSLWVIPAKVGGYWDWRLSVGGAERSYSAIFEQRFQSLEGVVRTGNRHGIFHDLKLHGENISFVLMMTLQDLGFTRHEFNGRVRGDTMQGAVKITLPPKTNEEDEELETLVLPWQARRPQASAFFAPTGVEIQ